MELLVLKYKEEYLRIKDKGYELTGMNKASVYPVADEEKVIKILESLKEELCGLQIKQLTITEKDYQR